MQSFLRWTDCRSGAGKKGVPEPRAIRPVRVYARAVQQTRVGAASQTKFLLEEARLPRRWYNILPDMPTAPQPVLHPGTGQPVGPDDLAPLFPMALIGQEVSDEPEIEIPEEILELYSLWRPTPLFRAHRLEQAIGTRSAIFYKYEGVSPPGSHKPNTAVAQAYYNKQEGRTRLATETGAGQWRSALARCSRSTPTRRAASGSRSRRRSRTPRGATTPRTRSAACSTTCSCTR